MDAVAAVGQHRAGWDDLDTVWTREYFDGVLCPDACNCKSDAGGTPPDTSICTGRKHR